MRQITKNTNGKGIGYHPYLDLTSNNCIFKDIIKSISNSLVLWYDIKKQQATNEGMAATPILRDLSGNGHDATCYNFAWAGMSGVGGYLPTGNGFNNPNNTTGIATIEGNKVHITHTPNINCAVYNNGSIATGETRPSTSFKVTGLTGTGLVLKASVVYGLPDEITEDGVYTFPEFTNTSQISLFNDLRFDETSFDKACDITIEQLPQYPGALVYDGVDDYGVASLLPSLTKEGGYTVIAKRASLNKDVTAENYAVASKAEASGNGAFLFTLSTGSTCNFGKENAIRLGREQTIWQTSAKFCGQAIEAGNGADTGKLTIGTPWEGDSRMNNMALYSLLLFDRDLTDNEIEWVKKNMIEGEGVMKYDWSRSPWRSFLSTNTNNRGTSSVTSYRLTVNSVANTARVFETIVSLPSMESYRIKVSNLPEGVSIYYSGKLNNKETNILTISKDGIYELPPIETESINVGFRFNKTFENENVIIQQLLS